MWRKKFVNTENWRETQLPETTASQLQNDAIANNVNGNNNGHRWRRNALDARNSNRYRYQPNVSQSSKNIGASSGESDSYSRSQGSPRNSLGAQGRRNQCRSNESQHCQSRGSSDNRNVNNSHRQDDRRNAVGAQFMEENIGRSRSCQNSETNNGSHKTNNNHKTNQLNFFGFRILENYLKMEADSVVISIHSNIKIFEEFLKTKKAFDDNMFPLLLKVLSEKAFSDESNMTSYQNIIVGVIASNDNITLFLDKCLTLEENLLKFMYNVADFIKRRMPVSAADRLSGVVGLCIARLALSNNEESVTLLQQFQNLFKSLQEKKKLEEVAEKARKAPLMRKFTESDSKYFDQLKPPEDFRQISVIPTVDELVSKEPSFLRPNKHSGAYQDADHYLDVQFRLLREDFLQPLKLGIQEFMTMRLKTKEPKMPKGSPIRLYYNVKFINTEVINEDIHYWIKLGSNCSKIRWENSKRLLPGNLLLFTKNNATFNSVVFATVGIRKVEKFKKDLQFSIIAEKFVSDEDVLVSVEEDLLMMESEIYWESFRHVLKTAQNLDLNAFPLAKYILRSCAYVEPPPSLQHEEEDGIITTSKLTIEFRTILSSETNKDEHSELQRAIFNPRPPVLPLLRKYIVDPLLDVTWPSAKRLGLDANQFEAFKAALTKQFVIIQGPPGTGKTFVGLRIAEIILQNPTLRTGKKLLTDGSELNYKGPLICICYTNHALDQFLEGILKIKRTFGNLSSPNIVRVGGRSKSEILREFNLRVIARRTSRTGDGVYWRELREIEVELKEFNSLIKEQKEILMELEKPSGIFQFEELENIYGFLCLQYSNQLMDCFSSPSFFNLTDAVVSAMKQNGAMNVVKKWFEYLPNNVNPNKNSNITVGEDQETEEDDEVYNMEELMEHRMELENTYFQFEHTSNLDDFHVENLSVLKSRRIIKECEAEIQRYNILENDSLDVVCSKNIKQSKIREQQSLEVKRIEILTEIFRCLSEKIVKIPDVTNELEKFQNVNVMQSKQIITDTFPLVSQRYAAYLAVANRAKQFIQENLKNMETNMLEKAAVLSQLKRQHDVQILKNAEVVGMTTTGAAKFNDLLVKMKSRIVIVEEAAEVLEAHIVTSLTKYTDHLILIGDHKQLKPSTAVYDLSCKYGLDVSLFERMVNNRMTCYSLLAQHRMRPEIADLIRGPIYDKLNDSPNVLEYGNVQGMTKNLFFLTHDKFEKSEGDSLSKLNEFEADFLTGLAGYLMKQGHESSSITVLSTYTGQMFILKSRFRQIESLKNIQITCVDNFQGEENDIILLSLVRSNREGKMGFLKVSNRVCVALSRAKKGLYIVGNMNMLSKEEIWHGIKSKLEKRGEIGAIMKVVCQEHKRQSEISNGAEFAKKCPEGGCSELCGKLLKCDHFCTRFCHGVDLEHEVNVCHELCKKPCLGERAHPCSKRCHFGKVCDRCDVMLLKMRSCGHIINVGCHANPEEVYCIAEVERILKCDHIANVRCSQIMENYLCRIIVDKVLLCGHESKLMCHTNPHEYQCDIKVKKKLPCSHERIMKCCEKPEASMCKTLVEKMLPCGHAEMSECRIDAKNIICKKKVTALLLCGHSLDVACVIKTVGKIQCVEFCEERLSCGHSCPLKCHYLKDRYHKNWKCKQPCAKSCPEGHRCMTNHECSTACRSCRELVERILPECGHIKKIYCFESVTINECNDPCSKKLQCGHLCRNKCYENCGGCKEMVMKRLPMCGHQQLVPCNAEPVPENCNEIIKLTKDTLCGHEISVACNMWNSTPEEIQSYCTQPCNFIFPNENGCEHKCSGNCGSCLMGSLHQKCDEKCLRPLICGHLCNFPCSKNCPPCMAECQMKCEHSKCKKKCGDACFSCTERCSWKCIHKRCRKLCGEMCDRGPCDVPCEKKLHCGHLCIGFCGEKCPPLCRVCDKEKLTEFQLLYTEEEDDARFIWLQDCKHAIEVEGLTMHLNTSDKKQEIGLIRCPRCTTVIKTYSGRFGNIIRKTFMDVAAVKRKFYGNKEQNHRISEEIHNNLVQKDEKLNDYLPSVKTFYRNILYRNNNSEEIRAIDIPTLNSLQQILVWVKEILDCLNDFPNGNGALQNCQEIFGNIVKRQLPLSRFEVTNISNEIGRLIDIIHFYHRWNSASESARLQTGVVQLYTTILATLQSRGFYNEKCKRKVAENTKELERLIRTGLGISERERMEIIKALDMSHGHWFKCPNGHIYAIGECGGAMEIAICNECKKPIGGTRHSLLDTNEFAPEMDGASRPAYDTALIPQNFGF